MTRRSARKALATPAPLISQQTAWTLKMLADGGTLTGEPKGLNPKGATPWVYTARSEDERTTVDVPAKLVTTLAHAGVLHGRAGHIGGKPIIFFSLTMRGEQELERVTAEAKPG